MDHYQFNSLESFSDFFTNADRCEIIFPNFDPGAMKDGFVNSPTLAGYVSSPSEGQILCGGLDLLPYY